MIGHFQWCHTVSLLLSGLTWWNQISQNNSKSCCTFWALRAYLCSLVSSRACKEIEERNYYLFSSKLSRKQSYKQCIYLCKSFGNRDNTCSCHLMSALIFSNTSVLRKMCCACVPLRVSVKSVSTWSRPELKGNMTHFFPDHINWTTGDPSWQFSIKGSSHHCCSGESWV